MDNAKIDALSGWKVSSRFNDKERAALDWTEALVNVSDTFGKDSYFSPLKAHFSDTEISDLTFAISLMSAFNRLAIGMRQ